MHLRFSKPLSLIALVTERVVARIVLRHFIKHFVLSSVHMLRLCVALHSPKTFNPLVHSRCTRLRLKFICRKVLVKQTEFLRVARSVTLAHHIMQGFLLRHIGLYFQVTVPHPEI